MTSLRLANYALLVLGVLLARFSGASELRARVHVRLNGPWEYVKVASLDAPPPASGWRPCNVPGYLRGTQYERAWLRREFEVPESMRGKRIKLRFGGVKFNSRILVHGQPVGGCFGGYRPFEVDVTDVVRFGETNKLLVGVHDWTGVFTPGRVDLGDGRNWSRMRGRPKDKILSPIGGIYDCYGIWDDVTLVAVPPVYVKDLFIKSSVRRGELVVDVTLANESDVDVSLTLEATVEDDGRTVLSLPHNDVRIPAGDTARVTLRQPWDSARLWSPDDPHLYHLRTKLSSGDELVTRFGFREFWVDGHRFVLNGKRINLLATSWWPPREPMTREQIRERWQTVKRIGCVAFRTHTQPWRSVHYDVADELGLLMIVEGAVWNDASVYRINDPAFWDNYAGHLKAMIDRDKNRPSVVMWSLENEFYGGRFNDDAPAKADLVRMGRLVKQWDPTRPMFYESDGDPGGVADAIGIHYPHEYPQYTCWPNEAYWLAEPRPHWGHQFTNGQPEFFWRKDKPLYVGEFLWLPSADPSWHTVFFGDEAYRDYRRYRNRGKAESWKMQILGYRHHEVAGISPWTVIEGGPLTEENELYRAHQYAYQKIAAYCHDYDTRFYAGREVKRRVEVFNDVLDDSALGLNWKLTVAGKVVDQGTSQLQLGPGDHQMVDVVLKMPDVPDRDPEEQGDPHPSRWYNHWTRKTESRVAATWTITVHREGKQVFKDEHHYTVFPIPKPDPRRPAIGMYDPLGDTARAFKRLGIRTAEVADITSPPSDLQLLVIGAGTLDDLREPEPVIGEMPAARKALVDYAAAGGRLLVLRQTAYPRGWFDLSLTDHQSTMTFPLHSKEDLYPLFGGLDDDDFKFWRGDHLVSNRELLRPMKGGFQSFVVSGSRDGLIHAPLIERRIRLGTMMHCQLRLIEKSHAEPAADRFLLNLIDYLRDMIPRRPWPTALVGGGENYRARLRDLGLEFEELKPRDPPDDPLPYALIICRGQVPDEDLDLGRWVGDGGKLLLHRVSAEIVRMWDDWLFVDTVPYSGPVSRVDEVPEFYAGITREDLYWLGQHEGISWSTTPRADEMADMMFVPRIDEAAAAEIELEQWQLDGKIVQNQGNHVVLATAGSVAGEIDFPWTAPCLFGVVARGSPCNGQWPVARVSVDGKPVGEVTVSSPTWKTFTTFGKVKKGRRTVKIEFINDASNQQAGEDRNLYLDRLLYDVDDDLGRTLLTSPPVVVGTPSGDYGTLVIDQLRWDTERRNAAKASRYAAAMLTAMHGDFPPRYGVAVECETMQPQPGMPHFHVFDDHVAQATNGTLSKAIRIGKAGRYRLELVARGTALDDEYPLVEIRLGDQPLGRVQVASEYWRTFSLEADLPAGQHELTLEFTNDANRPGEADRNVMYDKVVFYRVDDS